jgi:hypothetical protein
MKGNKMTTFANAVKNQSARTTNGMKARASTANALVDLFFKIGASRGKNIVPDFTAAFAQDKALALRIAAWSRDVRGGAGERQLFRDILVHLETHDPDAAFALMQKVPELGRWDDLFAFKTKEMRELGYMMLGEALQEGNGLAAKWTPRKGPIAVELREFFGLSPKQFRKNIVSLTNVVEQKMCAKDWDGINFSHVPSVAAARYKKAFNRNTVKYGEYVASLVKGEAGVKVNANAVFPHDVLKGRVNSHMTFDKTELDLVEKQWEALPNYVGDASILPIVDVSGSMEVGVGGAKNLTCMDVAVSLGLYLADKNKGKFKDTFMTFSSSPQLLHLKGNINEKINQMVRSNWSMSTDIVAAFNKVLSVALENEVPQEEMPDMLLILSDMQFNHCVHCDDTAMHILENKFKKAGYAVPKVVFWNLNAYDNVPVKFDKKGAALVSGFSHTIMKSLLAGNLENFTPEQVMLETIMKDRYAVL